MPDEGKLYLEDAWTIVVRNVPASSRDELDTAFVQNMALAQL
jgi:hypothetical protein